MDTLKYYQMVLDSTYVSNMNKGIIVPNPNQTQAGLALNTGPMSKEQQLPNTSNFQADKTQAQSHYMNPKNLNKGYQ